MSLRGTTVFLLQLFAGSNVAPVSFRDVAPGAGIDFVLRNSPTPNKYLIETMPGGVAALDYDNDGRIDVFFTNGAAVPELTKNSPRYANRLYRNLGGMRFADVTEQAGIAGEGYSVGVAAGDFDNDGNVDLFVAGFNSSRLYRNTGGAFKDVTQTAGIKVDGWAVAAGWFDYDNDGRLDLWVVRYLHWSPEQDRFCGDPSKNLRVYCHPRHFSGTTNLLFHNKGDGSFEDVSASSGVSAHTGKGMSVAFGDYDRDGWLDVFVTNDTVPNFLFHNERNGTFKEVGLAAGVALTDDGRAISSMGADFRDYDNDGWPDLSVTALAGETFPLFHNDGKGLFRDVSYQSRVGPLSVKHSGWANAFVDLNNDGWKDLFVAASHVNDRIGEYSRDVYKEENRVFLNAGGRDFRDAGSVLPAVRPHRGAAFADFNNDGKLDVVVTSLGEAAELWENTSAPGNHWLIVKLRGTRSNRDGIGAEVRVAGQTNHFMTAIGYASSSHAGVHFGLGSMTEAPKVEVRWPSGIVQTLNDVKADQALIVREPDSPAR